MIVAGLTTTSVGGLQAGAAEVHAHSNSGCAPGYYYVGTVCESAPAGSYSLGGSQTSPTPCQLGSFQPLSGQSSCLLASPGTFVSAAGSATATSCGVGTYQPQSGQASCLAASPGYYDNAVGEAAEFGCPAGNWSSAGAAYCTSSPSGYASLNQVLTECQPGTYAATGSSSCSLANAGTFVAAPGSSVATLCAAGTYQPQSGQASCLTVSPGYYVNSQGATAESGCPAGNWSSPGATTCTSSPAGYASLHQVLTECQPGTYAATGSSSCSLANAGTFVAAPGSSVATLCAAGTYQPQSGQASCLLADPGHYAALPGATSEQTCPSGYSSAAGASVCTQCPTGETSNAGGACGVAPTITSPTSVTLLVGAEGSFTITTTGTPTPSITESGSLDGLTLSGGVLSGVPSALGTFPITITADDGVGVAATQSFELIVTDFIVATTSLPAGTRGTPYSATLASAGLTGVVEWKKVGTLPKGLKLSSTGVLSGTPSTKLAAGNYTVSVSVTTGKGKGKQTATASLVLALS